jgi:hypothetical protein
MLSLGTAANAGVIDWIAKNVFGFRDERQAAFDNGLPSPYPRNTRNGTWVYDRHGLPTYVHPTDSGTYRTPDGAEWSSGPK